jgi:hypothetical protein
VNGRSERVTDLLSCLGGLVVIERASYQVRLRLRLGEIWLCLRDERNVVRLGDEGHRMVARHPLPFVPIERSRRKRRDLGLRVCPLGECRTCLINTCSSQYHA